MPEKSVTKYEDNIGETVGYSIAGGDIISFTEVRYKGDVTPVMFARSKRAAKRVGSELKELPINVRIIEIEGGELIKLFELVGQGVSGLFLPLCLHAGFIDILGFNCHSYALLGPVDGKFPSHFYHTSPRERVLIRLSSRF